MTNLCSFGLLEFFGIPMGLYTHIVVVVYFWSTELEKAQFAAFFLINFLAENPRPYQMVYRPGDMIGKNVQSIASDSSDI